MADSQEETVNSHIIALLIRFTHTLYQMYTFHTVLSKQAYGIMFEQYFNHYSILMLIHQFHLLN